VLRLHYPEGSEITLTGAPEGTPIIPYVFSSPARINNLKQEFPRPKQLKANGTLVFFDCLFQFQPELFNKDVRLLDMC
jgi:hypothetical protein